MLQKRGFRPFLFIVLLSLCILCPLAGCTHEGPETEPVPTVVAGDEPLYDGILRTMEHGDCFYTPHVSHCVTDSESAVLYYNNLLLVFTQDDLPAQERSELASAVGGEAVGCIHGGLHAFQILVENSTLAQLTALSDALLQMPSVLYACPEYPVQIMSKKTDRNPWADDEPQDTLGCEDDPNGLDWWAEAIGAYTAWSYSDRCQPIHVGIADDGFYTGHEDLLGKISFVTNESCNTAAEHGTHVAGIIAAENNEVGIRGIADTAKLYCADLWPTDELNAYHTMAEYVAVIHAFARQDVRVVNNSWACVYPEEDSWHEIWTAFAGDYSQLLRLRLTRDLIPTAEFSIVLIAQLLDAGYADMILVQGAGNSGMDARYSGFFASVTEEVYNAMPVSVLEKLTASGITYDAIDQRILVVGAVENSRDPEGNYMIVPFSAYGETVDIFAPGFDVFSTIPSEYNFYYTSYAGTSQAAPMVTGSAALLWSIDPELPIAELRQLLLESGTVMAVGPGRYPMLNVGAAVKKLVGE